VFHSSSCRRPFLNESFFFQPLHYVVSSVGAGSDSRSVNVLSGEAE